MNIQDAADAHGFTVRSRQDLPEIDGEAILLTHGKSKARLLYLRNDDPNKAFAIGFRTPPQDDTGVFHILEHSVLCGSDRFPVKEPFVDLLKGSMQTFLNAMTFPDKTVYPVASTNEKDLFNLMDVYLDAVFHPQIYRKRAIFEQEGWHLELTADDGQGDPAALSADETTLTYNGVVYNEMKGALSDANSVLYDKVQAALFPDTCYAFESGGTPEAIPTLTYENFLEEHRRHYRPDNSYLFLYGNLDCDRALAFLDERYLGPVADEQAREEDAGEPRPITLQAPLVAPHSRHTMDTAPENACSACGYVIGPASSRMDIAATDILLDALFGSNEAPLKRALLNRGIAHDIQATVADSLAQPFVLVQLQRPHGDGAQQLDAILQEEVSRLLEEGLDKELVQAALSHSEFQLREHEMGMADGVVYAIQSLAGWLYDDEGALDYLRYEAMFASLRQALEGHYFEQLLERLFCANDHRASVEIVPAPGLSDDSTAEKLQAENRALTPEERRAIVEEEARLRALQEQPDSPEALATLPRLNLTDLGEAPDEAPYRLLDVTPLPCLRHTMATRGIAYGYRYFDLDAVAFDEVPLAAVLCLVLGKLDTAEHTAAQIDTLVQAKLGNLSFFMDVYEDKMDPAVLKPRFVVSASALAENACALAWLPREVMTSTVFDDKGKILDILKQRKIALEQAFVSAGNSCAMARLRSYCTPGGVLREQMGNVGFYSFLCELIDDFDQRFEGLRDGLADLCRRIFCDDRCLVSFAGDEGAFDEFWKAQPQTGWTSQETGRLTVPAPEVRNEAFVIPSDVSYAACGWDRRLLGQLFNGSWLVASRALSYDYLWNEVRVKGGAYGVGFQGSIQGDLRFYSYRDPHLDSTLERFAQAVPWLSHLAPTQEELDGFVVATVASLDAPIKARALLRRQDGEFFTGCTRVERLAIREEVIQTDGEALRDLAPILAEAEAKDARCVFGGETLIDGSSREWHKIALLSGE